MNFKVLNFQTIRISTTDLKASAKWFSELFGVKPVEDLEFFVAFKIGNVCFDISIADEKSPSSPGGSVGYWRVDDLNAVIQKALSLGGEIYRGPLRVDEVQRTIVQIINPLGNVIGFEADY